MLNNEEACWKGEATLTGGYLMEQGKGDKKISQISNIDTFYGKMYARSLDVS